MNLFRRIEEGLCSYTRFLGELAPQEVQKEASYTCSRVKALLSISCMHGHGLATLDEQARFEDAGLIGQHEILYSLYIEIALPVRLGWLRSNPCLFLELPKVSLTLVAS